MSSIPVTLTFKHDPDAGDTLILDPVSITLEKASDEVVWRCSGMPEGGGFSLRFNPTYGPIYGPFMAFRFDQNILIGYGNVGSGAEQGRDYPYEAYVRWGSSEVTVRGIVVNRCLAASHLLNNEYPNGCTDTSPGPPCPDQS